MAAAQRAARLVCSGSGSVTSVPQRQRSGSGGSGGRGDNAAAEAAVRQQRSGDRQCYSGIGSALAGAAAAQQSVGGSAAAAAEARRQRGGSGMTREGGWVKCCGRSWQRGGFLFKCKAYTYK